MCNQRESSVNQTDCTRIQASDGVMLQHLRQKGCQHNVVKHISHHRLAPQILIRKQIVAGGCKRIVELCSLGDMVGAENTFDAKFNARRAQQPRALVPRPCGQQSSKA